MSPGTRVRYRRHHYFSKRPDLDYGQEATLSYQDVRGWYQEQDDPPEPRRQWLCRRHNTVMDDGEACDWADDGEAPCELIDLWLWYDRNACEFGLCYECRDGDHERCIGVPCQCPCDSRK